MIDTITKPLITMTCPPELAVFGFRVQEIEGHEELGCLFEYRLDLVSKLHEIDLTSLLGQTLTVHVPLELGQVRHLSGMVFRAGRGRREGNETEYSVTLLPEQHLLSFCHDCRIFQGKTVVAVVQKILEEHKLRPFKTSLYEKPYRTWDYLTQYRESDWDFVRRILALEGIYFYFNHLEDGHEMVLADSISSHQAREGWETVPLLERANLDMSPDCLRTWNSSSEVRTNDVVLRDFEFRLHGLSAILAGKRGTAATEEKHALERYEYPGGFVLAENKDEADAEASNAEGDRLARVRLEEKQSSVEVFSGGGPVRGLQVGASFGISNSPEFIGRQFTIVSTDVVFRNPAPESSAHEGEGSYVRLMAIDHKTPFRMPRLEKPVVLGPQTAQVVGGSTEEIWTDKYGRIRVQFHWDREKDTKDEDRSCWVRVAHPWAGNRWGAVHIPRVGNEVVVEFLEGDPDRPLVTGSVYNADNMPPYTLPDNKTQTGIKTRSTKGGNPDNFNEIRFEDKKGKEELHIQAEKDMSTHVKHCQSTSVDADRSVSVGGNQSTTVTHNETQTYKAKRKMDVTGTNDDTITGAHTGIYKAGRTETVTDGDTLTVTSKDKKISVANGAFDIDVNKHFNVTKASTSMNIDDNFVVDASGKVDLHNPGTKVVGEGTKLALEANSQVTITCGASSISLKSDGTIEITGQTVKIGNANNNAAFEPAGTTINGIKLTSAAVGIHEISGALIKVG